MQTRSSQVIMLTSSAARLAALVLMLCTARACAAVPRAHSAPCLPHADMPFEFPFDRYQGHDLVVWGQRERVAKGDMEGDTYPTASQGCRLKMLQRAHPRQTEVEPMPWKQHGRGAQVNAAAVCRPSRVA